MLRNILRALDRNVTKKRYNKVTKPRESIRYSINKIGCLKFVQLNSYFWAARLIIWAAKFVNGQQLFILPNFTEKYFKTSIKF
jgi:hypothetical protein